MKEYLRAFFKEFEYEKADSEFILSAYDTVTQNGESNKLLREALSAYENSIEIDYTTKIIEQGNTIARHTALHPYTVYLLLYICLTKRLKAVYQERGLDMQIYRDSVLDLKWKLEECKLVKGICGTFAEAWFAGFFKLTRFALGRLQFELTRSLVDYDKNGIKLVKNESTVINVHIPRSGKPLDEASCDSAYAQARAFFKGEGEPYPFMCHSWLLFPENERILSPKSNVYRFMQEYDIVEYQFDFGENLWRLFDTDEQNPDRLPTDSSFRRNYVDHLKNGGRVGWGTGILKKKI